MLTVAGEKLNPPLPTITLTVVADAAFRERASKTRKLSARANALALDAASSLFSHFEFDGRVAIFLSSLLGADPPFTYRA